MIFIRQLSLSWAIKKLMLLFSPGFSTYRRKLDLNLRKAPFKLPLKERRLFIAW